MCCRIENLFMSSLLLPFRLPGFVVDQVSSTETVLMIDAHAIASTATCPYCQQASGRIHSYYIRSPRDLPLSEYTVQLRLHVRRFRCLNRACTHQTFAERLPTLVPVAARRTVRLTTTLQQLGFALGGEAGARQTQQLRMSVSADTVLRIVRRAAPPAYPTPRVVGVDDFAFRKGHVYGTVLVDLERRHPVDLLPDRTADTFAAWLRAHPGIEVIARDRSTEYARGATEGAPDAVQVVDRWHLIRNLRDVLERMLDRLRTRLQQLDALVPASDELSIYDRLTRRSSTQRAAQQASRTRRLARYEQVRALAARGLKILQIARQLKISRVTVRRYLASEQFVERARPRRRSSIVDPYVAYLQERWDAGCHNGVQLWREIRDLGYSGSRRPLVKWVVLRRERLLGGPSGYGRRPLLPIEPLADAATTDPAAQRPTLPAPRQLAWMLLRPLTALDETEQALLQHLRQEQEVATAYDLAQQFLAMVRERTPEAFDPWLEACAKSGVRDLVTFGAGLQRESNPVRSALELPYSTGPVEGHVNRIKVLKRQGYGRAKFDLLRQRVLLAA
jgi:transposase